ncbi:methyltransferase domain-containing protein [Ditylenchus destructor]|nr:methyltransferase domain-containing protein [Ditylenchus destructor]
MGGSTIMESVARDVYRNFWNGFSSKADNSSMMLNKDADQLEALDRENILASLPDYTGMDVLDIGAGIGRFTTIFAQRARHVISSDFIDEFIKKNRQLNSHFKNISYQVGDAIGLQLAHSSLDMIFSNWLMMYMSDDEVLQFLSNALQWLRPGGFIHLRESCSESSTGKATASLHDSKNTNPTRYRFSSSYIQLLQAIRYTDSDGQQWRLNVEWSCSVPTYVKYFNNWRQVHWLARKVQVEENPAVISDDSDLTEADAVDDVLLQKFQKEWPTEQSEWDSLLDGELFVWTDSVFDSLTRIIPKSSTVLSYNPRKTGSHLHVNAHFLAENFNYNVWNVETNPYFYRTSLTKANHSKDQRVHYSWHANIQSTLEFWRNSSHGSSAFDGIIATEFFSELVTENATDGVNIIKEIIPSGFVVSLECFDGSADTINENGASDEQTSQLIEKLNQVKPLFKSFTIEDVTEIARNAQQKYFAEQQQSMPEMLKSLRWVLIEAQI